MLGQPGCRLIVQLQAQKMSSQIMTRKSGTHFCDKVMLRYLS